jgi:hypothetical protein
MIGEVRALVCGWSSGASMGMGTAMLILEDRTAWGLGLILVGAAVAIYWVSEV